MVAHAARHALVGMRARLSIHRLALGRAVLGRVHGGAAAVRLVASDASPGSVRAVGTIAWPVVLSMLSFTAMGVVDTLFVAQLGRDELAGAALGNLGAMVAGALVIGGMRGVNIVSSQAIGAGRPDVATRAAWAGVGLALVSGLAVAALTPFADGLAVVLGGDQARVRGFAAETLAIRCAFAPLWFLLPALSQGFQGRGDTRVPMVANVVANIANIGMDALLVFGVVVDGEQLVPALGVAGAAWATAIALGAAGLAVLAAYAMRYGWARPGRADLRAVAGVGYPVGVRFLLDIGGWATLTALMARVGAAEVAATQVAVRIISVSFLPGFGIGEATSILVGQAVGARDEALARRAYASGLTIAVAIMAAFAVVFALWPALILRAFAADAEVLAIGRTLLLWAAAFQLFDALCLVAMGALGGAGDTRFVMWASILGTWGVLVPLGWWWGVQAGFGAAGVWAAVTVECALRAVVCAERWRRGGWRDKAVVAAPINPGAGLAGDAA